jgi:hypothetical protein
VPELAEIRELQAELQKAIDAAKALSGEPR